MTSPELAHGGTLFLDEIGAMPWAAQEKILRAVEYGVFERVGGWQPVAADARIIGATNADLPQLVAEGRFMPDLLDRLAFEALVAPPLRERREDIPLLAAHFAARMADELEWSEPPRFSAAALTRLAAYSWPGNIRELKNVVERAVYQTGEGRSITEIVFDPFAAASPNATNASSAAEPTGDKRQPLGFDERIVATEIALIREALIACRHNQRQAAARLGLRYHQFRGLLRKHAAEINKK
ncbi:MAG: sigma 54-interacting transcriptional regulator [Desulfobulbaceae bacterium]|jgi:psp operon transcriptional activator|nr:sigma 54-interacting transcriptional regulator [Desulfobulbaceae bacterium]